MYKLLLSLFMLFGLLFSACSDKYLPLKSQYGFKSSNGLPDYSLLDYWAAHPWKKDPSDSISKALSKETRDSLADVFFIYPTSFTQKATSGKLNADIDDSYLNAKTDYSSILYQATVFNQHARVYSPRYRQANIAVFFDNNSTVSDSVFDIAYSDIKQAFQYYLLHWNANRPIIIAAHSQGSKMANRLLKEFFDSAASSVQPTLQNKLVVAYILGWPVPKEYFTSLKMCADSLQTGCICSWRTVRKNYVPSYLGNENGNSLVTNPLTWTTDEVYASKKLNKGSILLKFNKLYRYTTDAQISNGLLGVRKPRFPGGFFYFTKNYHAGDINLFYLNIRENVQQRINHFFQP